MKMLSPKHNLLIIISDTNKSHVFEWTHNLLVNTKNYNIYYVLIQNKSTHFEDFLKKNEVYYKVFTKKKIFMWPINIIKLIKLILRLKIDIIHAHLIEAGAISMTAGFFLRVKKRIYTRHYSTLNHVYYPKMVYIDRAINYFSTHLICISNNVANVLIYKEKVKLEKVHLIEHGLLFNEINTLPRLDKNDFKSKCLRNINSYPIIGVVSRLLKLKGINYIIDAFKLILNIYPNAHLLIIGNDGNDKEHLINYLNFKIHKNNFTILNFDENIFSIYPIFDFFIHVPIDADIEAFGQTYIESLASKVPCIFTLSGIAKDFIINNKNAIVVSFKNSDEIYQSLINLIENPELTKQIVLNGYNEVLKRFKIEDKIKQLNALYLE